MPFKHTANATVITGDSVNVYRAMVTHSALGLNIKTGMLPNRQTKVSTLLAIASEYTGHRYKRHQKRMAHTDLGKWIAAQR